MKTAPCKDCGATWHTKSYHNQKPRKPLVAKKRMRPESKKHKEYREATTAEFWELNPPDKAGMWTCYLQVSPFCLRHMTKEEVNPEHTLSKTRHPGLRWDAKRLKPACSPCNEFKGSRDYIDGQLV